MKYILAALSLSLYTMTSLLFGQQALAADETTRPEIDRIRPEQIERATFSMG